MSFDPFGDFETTGYLRNSLGLKDPAEVKENEHFSFEMGLDEALSYLERTKNLNYQALLQVHRLLFEKFYPWAGRDRLELVLIFLSERSQGRSQTYLLRKSRDDRTRGGLCPEPGEQEAGIHAEAR